MLIWDFEYKWNNIFLLPRRIRPSGMFPFRINYENMNFIENLYRSLDGWSSLSQDSYLYRTTQRKLSHTSMPWVGLKVKPPVFNGRKHFCACTVLWSTTGSGEACILCTYASTHMWFGSNQHSQYNWGTNTVVLASVYSPVLNPGLAAIINACGRDQT